MRVTRFGVFLAGVAVLAAGCGTTHASSGGGVPVSVTAAARGTAALSARIAETTTMLMGGMSVSYTTSGEFDFAHGRGTLSMRAPFDMTTLFLRPKVYVKVSGNQGTSLPKGKTWMELDTTGFGGPGLPGVAGPFGASSPADLLTSLTAISGSVKKTGAGTVRGVPVTGYRVVIDPAKAAKAAGVPAAARAGYRQFLASLGQGTISAGVWVDAGNLVRRVTVSLRLPASAGGGSGGGTNPATRVTETTDFYDFGVPVSVSPPPAAQVASMSQVIASQGAVSSGSGISGPQNTPPAVSGTLTAAQSAAVEQAVTAFFTAMGRNDTAALARTVLPSQRSCLTSGMTAAPKVTVKSLRIVSATPAGTGKATVRFTVSATASLGGTHLPVLPQGPGMPQWLETAEAAGHWYVDLTSSTALAFAGPSC